MGCGKVFSDYSKPVKREMRAYIEDWEKLSTKKNYQRTCTRFSARYGGLSLYDIDMEKRYSIDDKVIRFVKGYRYALIGNPDHPYGTSIDHDCFTFTMTCLTESYKLTRILILN